MYHDVRNANGTWQPQGWGIPGGSTGFRHVAEDAMPDGSTQFVGVTSSGVLEHNIRSATGSWQGWDALSQPGVTVTNADIAGMPNGSSQIVESTTGGAILHNIRNANGSWQQEGWAYIGAGTSASMAAITGMPDGSSQLVAVAATGQLMHNIRFANGSWQGWKVVAVDVISRDVYFTSADIAGMPDGSSQLVDVVLVGNTDEIYHDVRYANGSWQRQGWAQLPNPNSSLPVVSADIAGMPNGSSQLIALTQD